MTPVLGRQQGNVKDVGGCSVCLKVQGTSNKIRSCKSDVGETCFCWCEDFNTTRRNSCSGLGSAQESYQAS
jgi:hypothetical protein